MYTRKDDKTLPLFPELFPLGGGLDQENRWLKLAGLIPWEEVEQIYRRHFTAGKGRPAKDSRLMIGLLLVKHIKGVSDRAVVTEFMESPYIQALCGYDGFVTDKRIIDPSLLSRSRKRLGKKFFRQFEQDVLSVLIRQKVIRPKDHMLDATVIPANIEYPTDVKLLHRCREWLCQVIRVIRKRVPGVKKVRTYARKAKAVFVNFRRKRKKTKKFMRKAQKKLLQFTRRNMKQLEELLRGYGRELAKREREFLRKRLRVVTRIYKQQYRMWKEKTHQIKDRIVSLHLPHIRPMVRGKDGKDVEFGPKALLSWVNGFCFLDYLSSDAYNEGEHAMRSLKKYRDRFGMLPPATVGDGIFGTRDNRKKLERLGVKNAFKPLGRPPADGKARKAWLRKKQRSRNGHMEGIIGHGKCHFKLDRILYRISGGEEIWTIMGLLGMNLSTALQRI